MTQFIIRLFTLGAVLLSDAALADAVPGSLSPEAAMGLLYGKSPQTLTDADDFSYRVFPVHQSTELQNLIDTVTERLLGTTIGTLICRDLLNGNPELLSTHLGISDASALKAANACGGYGSSKIASGVVVNSPDREPNRLTGMGASQHRQFIIVVTDRPDLTIDSWTEAYSNITTLFIHHSPEKSDLNLRHITQAIAHEMAIYFDAKSWPWGPDWNHLRALADVKIQGDAESTVMMAATNPAITAVLASIRAYKVERQMLRELVALGRLGPEPIFYSQADFPFLRLNCTGECLNRFILDQREWMTNLYRPLLAFSPHYRIRRLTHERLLARAANRPVAEQLLTVLDLLPLKYIQTTRSTGMIFENLLRPQTAEDSEAAAATTAVMNSVLLPSDLKTLAESKVEFPNGGDTMDLLTFLSIPILSDANSGLSSGPRPRIRTGATK